MTGYAHHLTNDVYAGIDGQLAAEEGPSRFEVMPDERIGHLRRRSRGRRLLRRLFTLLILGGCGWSALKANEIWPGWHHAIGAVLMPAFDVAPPELAEKPLEQPLPKELPTKEVAVEEAAAPPDSVAVENKGADNPAASSAEAADEAAESAPPLEPPAIENPIVVVQDPQLSAHQKRAAAAGLSPDLSRVLLAKLTAADLKNASFAIGKAYAETLDTASFVWPREAKPGQVSFRVHFVKGAAVNCRRYVVTVGKDGWSTTAPPMQKCGPKAVQARAL